MKSSMSVFGWLAASILLVAAAHAPMEATMTSNNALFSPPPLINTHMVQRLPASVDAPGDLAAEIYKLAVAAVADWNLTGLSLGVVANGSTVFAEGFGMADVAGGVAADNRTLFQIASNSKAFTSMLALTLVDEGTLDLDRPVRDAFPNFMLTPVDTLSEGMSSLTTHDLLSHRTGLPRHDIAGFSSASRAELLGRLKHQATDKPLRYSTEYSNEMFVSAGALMEELLGSSWEESVSERIFDKLSMQRTWANWSSVPASEALSKPYEGGLEVPYLNADVSAPAGGVVSNVEDLLKWVHLHLRQSAAVTGHEPAHPGPVLVQPPTYSKLLEGSAVFPLYTSFDQYTLGWWSTFLGTTPFLVHGGNLNGFSSNIGFSPTDGHAIVILTNEGSSASRDALFLQLADLLTGTPPPAGGGWTARFKAQAAKYKATLTQLTAELQRKIAATPSAGRVLRNTSEYVGRYSAQASYGMADYVVQEGEGSGPGSTDSSGGLVVCGQLVSNLTVPWETSCVPMVHMWYDTFAIGVQAVSDITSATLTAMFNTDGDGVVSSLSVPFEPKVAPIILPKV
jgi:CubicO group peptidase (beta-lactamase class C family)